MHQVTATQYLAVNAFLHRVIEPIQINIPVGFTALNYIFCNCLYDFVHGLFCRKFVIQLSIHRLVNQL